MTAYLDQSSSCMDTLYKQATSTTTTSHTSAAAAALLRNRVGDVVSVKVTQSSTNGVVGEVEVAADSKVKVKHAVVKVGKDAARLQLLFINLL